MSITSSKSRSCHNTMSQDNDVCILSDDDGSVDTEPLKAASKALAGSALSKPKPAKHDDDDVPENDSFDVVLPHSFLARAATDACTVMVEVGEDDAALLDYEGISGAIGRLQADDRGIILDLKGCQYHASILPGPTAMVVGLSKGGQLRVESITDEFATMVKTQDLMAKMDGVVEGEMDETFLHRDENVNRGNNNRQDGNTRISSSNAKENSNGGDKRSGKKREARRNSSENPKKKRKSNPQKA